MNEPNLVLTFSSDIDSIVEHNSSFDKGVLRICYVGRNRNGSFISKSTFEQCMPSIYNCPVVCRYDRDADVIGEHDVELVRDEDGGVHIINVTQPVGVIPSDAKYWWESIEDDSGTHEYLCVDVLLWKRQEAYRKIRENGVTDQSMEISVKEGEMVDGVYVIKRFEFLAFCLLGTAEPCYESASLEVFSRSELKDQLAEMMQEFKESFSVIHSQQEIEIIKETKSEGGNTALDEKNALIEEFGIDASTLDFSIEELTADELREKFEAMTREDHVEVDGHSFALAGQFRETLVEALRAVRQNTEFGETCRYFYVDHDVEAKEVYCHDVLDWNLYGMPYEMNGDNVVIDFDSKKRKKFAIVDFDEGEQVSMFKEFFELAKNAYIEKESSANEWESKFTDLSSSFEKAENELNELREFKANIEKDALIAKRNEVFSMFEDIAEVEAFIELRNNCDSYSIEDLEEKCYALRGRHGSVAKFTAGKGVEQKAPKLPARGIYDAPTGTVEPYGGVFQKYGITTE